MQITADGLLVDNRGNAVLGSGGQPINIDPLGPKVVIGANGSITQGTDVIGELGIVDVADKATLTKQGGNYFSGQDGQSPVTRPVTDSTLAQGYVEEANTNVVEEMVNMIDTYRAYESYQKVMHAVQDIDNKCISQVGRSS
jgi:flagellar basal-body rod protein FlgG